MSEHDLLEVVEIEEDSGLSHWGWDAYHKELQSREDVIMLVASSTFQSTKETEKAVVGFIVARLIADELHVNNIAVRPAWRRMGIGEQLLNTALTWARERRARRALLEVRASNNAAQALYRRCGFEAIGRRRRYYRMPLEDALIMSLSFESRP
jgi:[ribosomal protein S18]-alanine N-acetyltransferase